MRTGLRFLLAWAWLFGVLFVSQAWAAPVVLQSPTATGSQSGWPVGAAIDGNAATGWAVNTQPYTAAFETAVDVGYLTGSQLTFVLDHQTPYGQHVLGRFRLSVTTDHRDTFCDGLANGGDVTANWTALLPTSLASDGGATLTRLADGTIVATGTNPATDTYTITALTHLTGITGVRLETLHDPAQSQTPGPGRAGNRNFVLTDFALNETQYTGSPRWNADADVNWSDAAHWVGGVPNAPGATAEFGNVITAPRTVTVAGPTTVGTILFDNSNAYTLTGANSIGLQGSAGTAAVNVQAGSHVVQAPVLLHDPTTVDVSAGNTLALEGGVGGAGGLTKQGGGTLVVGQTNYNGDTVIAEGTLRLSNPVIPTGPVPGSTAWFDAADAGTLTLSGNNVTEWQSKAGTNSLTGVNTSAITYHTSGAGLNDLPYVNTNAANNDGNSFFDLATDIGDARTLFMVLKPTANPNPYTPFFGRNSGEGGNYMGLAAGRNGYVENSFSTPGLRTTGATPGQWFLDGTAFDPVSEALSLTDYRVVSVVAGANVVVQNIGRDRGFADRSLAADIGEILIYSSPLSDVERQAVEAYLLNKWLGVTPAGYGPGNLPASTALRIGAAGTFDLNGNNQTIASLADYGGAGGTVTNSAQGMPATLTVATAGSASFSGAIADGAGGVSLLKAGAGTLTLAATNTYTGGTTVEAGVLEVAAVGALGSSPIAIHGGTVRLATNTYNALRQSSTNLISPAITIGPGGTLTADQAANNAHNLGALTLNDGTLTSINGPSGPANDGTYGNFLLRGVTVGGSSMSVISSSTIAITSGDFNVADGADLLVSARILSGTLTKTGAGTMRLTAANTYSGPTTVAAGTLTLSDGGRLGGGTYNAPISLGDGAVLNFNMTNSQNLGGALAGTGTLAQNTAADYLYMTGDHSAFEGTFHNVAGNMFLASSAANSPSGGRARVDGGLLHLAPNGSADGTWRIGALSGTGGAVQPNRNLAGRTITLEVGGLNTDTSYSGVLQNNTNATPSALALAKVGTGTLTLAATSTYSGGTTVDAGTLLVNNAAGSGTGSGAVTVNSGAVLGGTGRIGGNVNVGAGGSLAPGESPGTLHLGGNLTFDPNAFFDIDIDAVDLADLVQMEGGTLWPNDAAIRVDLGFSPALGDSWTILQGEGIRDGMFNENVLVPNGSERLGWMWFDVSYGNSVILTVVPEPGTGLLLLAALACGMLVRRRRTSMIYDL